MDLDTRYAAGVLAGGAKESAPALRAIIPSVLLSTWIAEYPVKAHFRRRRPFIDVVRALVVGKEPGS